MNTMIAQILAQAATEQKPEGLQAFLSSPIFMMVIIGVLFWVMLIRPQRKAQKAQQERINSMAKGDRVVTNAGFHGTIVGIEEKTATVEIALGVNVQIEKAAITHVDHKG